ncbi:MAG: ATP-binding protein [bacterium]
MKKKPDLVFNADTLRCRAEASLLKRQPNKRTVAARQKSDADTQRLLHELQVHQIELEMQNAELHDCQNRNEVLREKYTDLYDFAPVGYFSLDEQGRILEMNLTGVSLLGVERSQLINRPFARWVALSNRPVFLAFLKRIFARTSKEVCEVSLLKEGRSPFWASLHGSFIADAADSAPRKGCRVVFSDITARKQGEEAKRQVEPLAISNQELTHEIVRRQVLDTALKSSRQTQNRLLEEAVHMQEQLRNLSRQFLQTQEAERKRISRELHNEITQALVSINFHLGIVAREATIPSNGLKRHILQTQRLVEKTVETVHRFALKLRPTSLDDLGLIPALHAFMKKLSKENRLKMKLTAFSGIENLSTAKRTVLYRVAQEALTNVARHAKASRAEVIIQKLPKAVRMRIKDDGKAFDPEPLWHTKKRQPLGLLGMRERVEMVGGTFTIESAPGQGTTILIQIPFNNGTEKHHHP